MRRLVFTLRTAWLLALLTVGGHACSAPTDPRQGKVIVGWGDSMTASGGGGTDYLSYLSTILNRPTFNGGVSGELSNEILKRVLADNEHRSDVTIFWMGRNNWMQLDTVKMNVAAAVASLQGNRRFLVLSLVNADRDGERIGESAYAQILLVNSALERMYPENYVDIRAVLVASYRPANADDVSNHENDVPPASVRADALHLNAAGNMIVARTIAAILVARGW